MKRARQRLQKTLKNLTRLSRIQSIYSPAPQTHWHGHAYPGEFLTVRAVNFFHWRNSSPTLQAGYSQAQGRDAVLTAKYVQDFPEACGSVSCAFASPTGRQEWPRQFLSNSGSIDPKILVIITRLRMPRIASAFWLPLQRFQDLVTAVSTLAAIRERRGRADLAALQTGQNRFGMLRRRLL